LFPPPRANSIFWPFKKGPLVLAKGASRRALLGYDFGERSGLVAASCSVARVPPESHTTSPERAQPKSLKTISEMEVVLRRRAVEPR
jgi:hypothetical protein